MFCTLGALPSGSPRPALSGIQKDGLVWKIDVKIGEQKKTKKVDHCFPNGYNLFIPSSNKSRLWNTVWDGAPHPTTWSFSFLCCTDPLQVVQTRECPHSRRSITRQKAQYFDGQHQTWTQICGALGLKKFWALPIWTKFEKEANMNMKKPTPTGSTVVVSTTFNHFKRKVHLVT